MSLICCRSTVRQRLFHNSGWDVLQTGLAERRQIDKLCIISLSSAVLSMIKRPDTVQSNNYTLLSPERRKKKKCCSSLCVHATVIGVPVSDQLDRCAAAKSLHFRCTHILLLQIEFNVLCEFYQHASEMLKKKKKNQMAKAGVITRGQFSESGKMSSVLQNHISSRRFTELKPTVARALMSKLPSCTARKEKKKMGKKKCSKNGA